MGLVSGAGSNGAFVARGLPKEVAELFEASYRKTPEEEGFEIHWGEPEDGKVFQICRSSRTLILNKKIRKTDSNHLIALLVATICRQGFTGSQNNKEIRFVEQSMTKLVDLLT